MKWFLPVGSPARFWPVLLLPGVLLIMVLLMNAQEQPKAQASKEESAKTTTELATFGGGCFWCTEAVFEIIPGVESVVSGYAGGKVPNPTYEQVCSGTTGHAEVIQIKYDPSVVSYDKLLDVFWQAHDPTTLNRQGADRGTQYRSVIFYHSEAQKQAAEASVKKNASKFSDPIVTQIAALPIFYPAEAYHQDYFRLNPNAPYCSVVIRPKLDKFKKY